MDPSLDPWFAEWKGLNAALEPFRLRVLAKEARGSKLNEAENAFSNLYYFWQACIVNSGDVFGYVHFLIEHKAAFKEVGAGGCLAALEELMPFYKEQQKLSTEHEKNAYWQRTRSARQSAEDLAEGSLEFGRLLLQYAQKNACKIGEDESRVRNK